MLVDSFLKRRGEEGKRRRGDWFFVDNLDY